MKPHIHQFLYEQVHPERDLPGTDIDLQDCPHFTGQFSVFNSAVATYYLPSDTLGQAGFFQEQIHAMATQNPTIPRHDCVLIATDAMSSGFTSTQVAQICLLLLITHLGAAIPCALVDWFILEGNKPDPIMGLWVVKPKYTRNNRHFSSIIHFNSVLQGIHLLPVHKKRMVTQAHSHSWSLDTYQ